MRKISLRFIAIAAVAGVGVSLAAQAAISSLDDANAHLVKTRALLEAARPASADRVYERHISRAEDLIRQAMHEIELAQTSASAPPKLKSTLSGKGRPLNPSSIIQLNPQPEPPAPAHK